MNLKNCLTSCLARIMVVIFLIVMLLITFSPYLFEHDQMKRWREQVHSRLERIAKFFNQR